MKKFTGSSAHRFIVLKVILCLCGFDLTAQEPRVAVYRDQRNYLMLFQNGIPTVVETQPVSQEVSNGSVAAWVNSRNDLIVWNNGERFDLEDATQTSYGLTETLLWYRRYDLLGVFDRGQQKILSHFVKEFAAEGETIAFTEQTNGSLKAYYRGVIYELESMNLSRTTAFKVGKNTVAYMSPIGIFKIFYQGEPYELESFAPVTFSASKNLVAYTDGATRTFKVFYQRKQITLEEIEVRSYQCGDDQLAYVSSEGYFKVFQNGCLLKVENFEPDFYRVRDHIILFFSNNQLQVMMNGERVVIDDFYPRQYKISGASVAWQDAAGRLKLFSKGEVSTIPTEYFDQFELNGDIVSWKAGPQLTRIYQNGNYY